MVSELWHHALQFLDKYGADARSYPIEELYSFADQTGILERHKQLLAKPFHHKEVDMKIMYYELIKMLIDYERVDKSSKNDPITSVGKIEGYQELTNRLQRYLNKRFITDVNELKKQQSVICETGTETKESESDNRKLEEKFEKLEKNFEKLKKDHSELKICFENIKEENHALIKKIDNVEKINKQVDKDLVTMNVNNSEMNERIINLNLEQKVFENIQNQSNKGTDEQLVALTDIIKLLKIRVDKHDEELSLIVLNDASQDERLDALEDKLDNKQDKFRKIESKQDSGGEILQNMKEGFITSRLENTLPSVLEDILNINKENKLLIERIETDEKRLNQKKFHTNNRYDDDLRKKVDMTTEAIAEIKENMKNKSSDIDAIVDTQSWIKKELMLLSKEKKLMENSIDDMAKQTKSDLASFSEWMSVVQLEKHKSDDNIRNVHQHIKECEASKDILLRMDNKLNETENKVMKLEQEIYEYEENNTKQNRGNNFDELMLIGQENTRKVNILKESVKKIEKENNDKIAEILNEIKASTLDNNSVVTMLQEKVTTNSNYIKQMNTETESLRYASAKNDERNNDIAVRITQLSLLASNTKAEMDRIVSLGQKDSSEHDIVRNELDRIGTEIVNIKDKLSNMVSINGKDFEDTCKSIRASGKQNKSDIDLCLRELSEYKELINRLHQQVDGLHIKMKTGKQEDVKQTSSFKVITEEEMPQFEQKIKTFVGQQICDSINKTDQNFSALITSSEDALKEEIKKQGNMVEELKKNIQDLHSKHDKEIEKEVVEIKEKLMAKLFEQMNMLMIKTGSLEEKFMKSENNKKEVDNHLTNLESADSFLQETNRILTEKVAFLQELSKKQEVNYDERIIKLEKEIQQTQDLALNLSQDIHHGQSNIFDLKHVLQTLEKELKSVKIGNEMNEKRDVKDLKEEFDKQCSDITEKLTDFSEKHELRIEQNNLDFTKQITNIEQLKVNKFDFEEYKKNVCGTKMKNDLAIDELDQKHKHLIKEIMENKKGINEIKICREEDQKLLQLKVSEQQQSLENFFKDIEEKFKNFGNMQREQISSIKMGESESIKETTEHLEHHEAEDRIQKGNCMGFGKTNLSALILEIYAAFRGYTLVVRSEGCVSEHQRDVLGVYRMVDSYNDRPVYKQDGGENYIYYSCASSSWLVGTVVGHSYGWLRNSSSARWVPDITSGWEYRPLIRSWGGDDQDSWLSDDGTLRIEPLQAVDSILSQIKDMKNKDVE